jgi:hypothetical protein
MPDPLVLSGGELWSSFFRLQAAYLLLWSISERYIALRFGPGLGPWVRVSSWARDTSFLTWISHCHYVA